MMAVLCLGYFGFYVIDSWTVGALPKLGFGGYGVLAEEYSLWYFNEGLLAENTRSIYFIHVAPLKPQLYTLNPKPKTPSP